MRILRKAHRRSLEWWSSSDLQVQFRGRRPARPRQSQQNAQRFRSRAFLRAHGPHACSRRNSSRAERRRDRRDAGDGRHIYERRHMRAGSPPPPPRPLSAHFLHVYDHPAPPPRPPPRNKRSPCPPPAPQWQAGEPSNEPSVSCWLDEAASEEASKDVWVCVHTHPCLDYEDDDKVPHAEDSW